MKGPIPYKRPSRKTVKGVVCIRPGSPYSRRLHRGHLQAYKHWWDDTLGLWFCVADRIDELCIPHRYVWAPNQYGYWRWLMADSGSNLNWAIAASGLVIYDEKGPIW